MDCAQFVEQLQESGVDKRVAEFVWKELQAYYFAPLTPHPGDRAISDLRVDPDDLSDTMSRFEKQFGRRWCGKWVGPDNPTLTEFGLALTASTEAK
jgi:hypothetical protein